MYSSILLPVDLQHEASWRLAAPKAVDLARASGAEIHLLTILPDFGVSVVSEFFPPDFQQNSRDKAGEALKSLAAQIIPSEIKSTLHLGHGDVVEQILTAAQNVSADLIVLASHKPDQMRDFLVGSHADRLVRQSTISVLVVR